jgi:putative salt-induced outer membrane protein YdiY
MKLKLKITNNIHFTKNVVTQLNSASDKFASSTDAITAALAKELQFHLLDKTTHNYYH